MANPSANTDVAASCTYWRLSITIGISGPACSAATAIQKISLDEKMLDKFSVKKTEEEESESRLPGRQKGPLAEEELEIRKKTQDSKRARGLAVGRKTVERRPERRIKPGIH